MGIYIKGMKKPTNCCSCPFSISNRCGITGIEKSFAEWYEDGASDCPVVDVPDDVIEEQMRLLKELREHDGDGMTMRLADTWIQGRIQSVV